MLSSCHSRSDLDNVRTSSAMAEEGDGLRVSGTGSARGEVLTKCLTS
jgi:hypothetical protein